ncbi:hypothetical protein Tco_0360333 [Tanacetum coccineum]
MTMSKIQLNSKFVNNMLPEWGRFVTAVKLNKGLKDSNFDQLYAYFEALDGHMPTKKQDDVWETSSHNRQLILLLDGPIAPENRVGNDIRVKLGRTPILHGQDVADASSREWLGSLGMKEQLSVPSGGQDNAY